ncbi:MAG: diguanylate cyclase/phosphodiesterase with sensor, partial [Verrucomicrobiales bacterium]|nr:diguanylate cyclase/phosphodiesterase with sensor [Verrucomicrobiales bacterium]
MTSGYMWVLALGRVEAIEVSLGAAIFALLWILTLRRQIKKRTRELVVSEGRFRTLVEQVPTPLIVFEAKTGRIEEINEAAAHFLNKPGKSILGNSISELGDKNIENQASTKELEKEFNELAGRGRMGILEWLQVLADGTVRTCEIRVSPMDNGARAVTAWRDITAQKRTEQKAVRSETTNRIISYFATSLLQQNTEEEILWDLAKNCVSRLGFVDCVIYLINPERTLLLQKAAFGPKSPIGHELLNPIVIPMGKGIVGSVAATGRYEVVPDTRRDDRYIVDDVERLSEIAVPIISNGQVLGVIDSEHPERGFFTQHHLEILASIANLCANKLVRVRAEVELQILNQSLERRIAQRTEELIETNQKLRQEIAERSHAEKVQKALYQITEAIHTTKDLPSLYSRIHAIIGELMAAQNFYIAVVDGAGLVTFPYHVDKTDATPVPRRDFKGMTEYVLRTGQATLADRNKIEALRSAGEYVQCGHPTKVWLGVPLSVNGRMFGVMAVQDHFNENAFGEAERRLLSFVADQTAFAIERKHNEEALRESAARLRSSEERFSKAFHSSPSLMSLTRMKDGRFIDVNEAFLRALGRPAEDVIGKSTIDMGLWSTAAERDNFLEEILREGALRNNERRWIIKDQPRIFLHSAEVITLQDELCLLTVAIDITESKRAEIELLKSLDTERELSQLKSNFVTTVSHEFRTPLEIIMSSGEILDRYSDRLPVEERAEHFQAIHNAVRRMSDLMEEVLLLGKVEAGKLQLDTAPLDLPEFCKRLIEEIQVATEDRCPINLQIGNLPNRRAMADESLLRHILNNLLSNAVKYSPDGVAVTLQIHLRSGHALFQIIDSGCGIPAADQD